MSRQEPKVTASGEASLDVAELIAAFHSHVASGERLDAIVRYLAAAPDWQEACRSIGGAFAESDPESGLKERKGP